MNTKRFRLNITHDTPFNTNMYLFTANGGDKIKVETTLQLQSFGGTSEVDSSTITCRLVSDSDTSGSPITDSSDLDHNLFTYQVPDGWPREPSGLGDAPPFVEYFNIVTYTQEPYIPARGRSLYLRLLQPSTLPDPNAEYTLRLEITITRID